MLEFFVLVLLKLKKCQIRVLEIIFYLSFLHLKNIAFNLQKIKMITRLLERKRTRYRCFSKDLTIRMISPNFALGIINVTGSERNLR